VTVTAKYNRQTDVVVV